MLEKELSSSVPVGVSSSFLPHLSYYRLCLVLQHDVNSPNQIERPN